MTKAMTVTLPSELVAEIESLLLQSDLDLDTFVCQIVQSYVAKSQQRQIQEQLARDYDELAAMYDELADELADKIWLPAENEALLQTEEGFTT